MLYGTISRVMDMPIFVNENASASPREIIFPELANESGEGASRPE